MAVRQMGWQVAFGAFEPKTSTGTFKIYRIAGNATYAFNKNIAVLGGVNFTKASEEGSNFLKIEPDIGFQAGLGFQFTESFGFDLKYVEYKLKFVTPQASINGVLSGRVTNSFKIAGPEAVFHFTF